MEQENRTYWQGLPDYEYPADKVGFRTLYIHVCTHTHTRTHTHARTHGCTQMTCNCPDNTFIVKMLLQLK